MKQTVVIGVTSGIAAYKTVELINLLKRDGYSVFIVMTDNASKMVSPKEFEKASGNKAYRNLFEKGFDYTQILKNRKVDHIELADKANLVVIAPATANILAKMSNGIADDFLTTMLLATQAPVLVFPSMNVHMWHHPSVQENILILKKRGIIVIDPDKGPLACGYEGKGRLPNVSKIHEEIRKILDKATSLSKKRIVVTSGGTKEPIDDVRFISNRSSGKMGVAIAQEAFLRGGDVVLIRAKDSAEPHYSIKQQVFETVADLSEAIKEKIKNVHIIFHTAAVSDFAVSKKQKGKIKSGKKISLSLLPTQKISDQIKKMNPDVFLVLFKAESESDEKILIKKGKEKLKESGADAIIVNDISQKDRGFEVDANEVIVITKNGVQKKILFASKKVVAEKIIDLLFI